MKNLKFMSIFILTLLVYVPLHVTEETIGNFPVFMAENWGIPNIAYAQWLFHNIVIFVPTLLLGLFMYSLDTVRFLPFGLGIPFWGTLNFFEHAFYTAKNASVAPGLFSSVLFLLAAALAVWRLADTRKLRAGVVIPALGCALLYWVIPVALILALAGRIRPLFL